MSIIYANMKRQEVIKYFKDEAAYYEFVLLHLDGEIRMKLLGISKFNFSNKQYATKWYKSILEYIRSDEAIEVLNTLYKNMTN